MPSTFSGATTARSRTAVVVVVQVLIALVHIFRLGSYLRGTLHVLYYSYFSDVLIPFGMYFLVCQVETSVSLSLRAEPMGRPVPAFVESINAHILRDWRLKALLVFGVASLTEVLQAFGVPLFGRTFDPLDFAMFAGGVLLAVIADRFVLERFLPGWSLRGR